MIKQVLYISFTVILLTLVSGESAYSQLLEGRNKLKTEKRERKGFHPFKKHVKKPAKTNQKPDVLKARPARVTKDVAGKGKDSKVKPKFTQEKAGQQGKYVINPRYSQPVDRTSDKKVAPRYTQEKAGQQGNYVISPRYTQDIAGKGYEKVKIKPRYSTWDDKRKIEKVNPRYSKPPSYVSHPASGGKKGFLPTIQLFQPKAKYKQGKEPEYYGPKVKAVYSPSNSMAKYNKSVDSYQKHISKGGKKSPYADQTYYFGPKVKTVYAPSNSMAKYNKSISSYQKHISKKGKKSPYADQTYYFGPKVKVVYAPSNSMAKYNKSISSYQKHISKGGKKSPYADQTNYLVKTKKRRKAKNSHPSANYLNAKYDDSQLVRNTKRKVNVTWVRTFGNLTQPKGVKKTPKKSKFDKEEKDIWNNQEREYTRN